MMFYIAPLDAPQMLNDSRNFINIYKNFLPEKQHSLYKAIFYSLFSNLFRSQSRPESKTELELKTNLINQNLKNKRKTESDARAIQSGFVPLNIAPALRGMTAYERYLAAKRQLNADRTNYRDIVRATKPHRARMLAFSDGTSGYGAYRFPRYIRRGRYGARRSFGRYGRRRFYGRGGFWGDLWSGIKKGAGLAFDALRPALAGALGSSPYGALANAALSTFAPQLGPATMPGVGNYTYTGRRLVGHGAYDPQVDAATSGVTTIDQDVPQIDNIAGTDGGICVKYKEYIGDVISAGTAFNMAFTLPLQPGAKQTFPWLSTIAQSFQQYRFHGLAFVFKTTSGELSTTQALGEIVMSANYNAADIAFTNKQQMLQQIMAVSRVPSKDAIFGIETAADQTSVNVQYTRGQVVPSGQPAQFYDLGTMYLATQGQPTGVTLGELWVTYNVELLKPQLPVSDGTGIGPLHTIFHNQTAVVNASPLGNGIPLPGDVDTIGCLLDATHIILPQYLTGTFQVVIVWSGNSTASLVAPTRTFSAGISQVAGANFQAPYTNSLPSMAFPSTTVTDSRICTLDSFHIDLPGTAQTITVGTGGTLPTGGTPSVAVVITQIA